MLERYNVGRGLFDNVEASPLEQSQDCGLTCARRASQHVSRHSILLSLHTRRAIAKMAWAGYEVTARPMPRLGRAAVKVGPADWFSQRDQPAARSQQPAGPVLR